MRLGRKGEDRASRGATVSKRQAMTNPELGPNIGADGLPGRAGYPNGPRTDLPTFFLTRRPDGKTEPVYYGKSKKRKSFG